MTYGDIIEYIEQKWDFEPNEDPEEAFKTISDEWYDDQRDTLENTIGDGKADVLKGIRELISRSELEPKAEEDFTELEQRADAIERGIDEISERIGATSESILTRIVNFFKGLFR